MRILVLSLFAVCICFANDNATISTSAIPDSNATISNASGVSLNEVENDVKISDDEKLKNDIITFDRIDYIKQGARIDDPFIYVYPQTQDDLENIQKAQQASFVLNGIFENKASINGIWVESGDPIEGWTVSNIQKDRVELESKFVNEPRVLYTHENKVEIK